MATSLKKIDFIFFDAGGGHRSAANALKAVVEQQGRPWQVRLVNLQELLDPLDVFRKLTGLRLQDLYNQMLKRGWTLGSPLLLPAMHGVIRTFHKGQVRILREFWTQEPPDLVVSLVPNFNRAMWEGLRAASPATPYVTILTDLADYPPHFWMERQKQYLICGTAKAVEQARAMGHEADRVMATSGMILRPAFYEAIEMDRAAERAKLGLEAERKTALVLFGGEGSNAMEAIARQGDRLGIPLQMILVCGRNEKLREKLERMQCTFPKYVEGFTQRIPYYMRLADFFVGKPGPGSISEALAMKLPVLVEKNAWTLVQERYNADWIEEQGVGVVVKSLRKCGEGLRTLLEAESFERYRAKAAAIENRAVFEIPDMLEQVMARGA